MLLYTHPRCLDHKLQPRHPESPERLRAILRHLERSTLLQSMQMREPNPVSRDRLEKVHDPAFLDALAERLPDEGLVAIDPDTYMCPATLEAAAYAAGAVVDAVKAVLADEEKRAFCAVRPPGHHAEYDAAMGFCFYNNVAIGAVTALEDPRIERVAILDFDVHQGNGTIDIFKDRPEVLVCSSFQAPFYPNRHMAVERPNVVNTRLGAGCTSEAFRQAIEADWLPALEAHRPQLVLISAGFDAHRLDPLAELNLDESDYRWITRRIAEVANECAAGRVVSTLEGGYDLDALARSVGAHLEALLAS